MIGPVPAACPIVPDPGVTPGGYRWPLEGASGRIREGDGGSWSSARFGRVRKLPSGRWQARYHGPDGVDRPAPATFATLTDARV